MATQPVAEVRSSTRLQLEPVSSFPNLRVLAWDRDMLYASRGYALLSARADDPQITWKSVGWFRPQWWRTLTSRNPLSFRLFRDGFHALAVDRSGNLVAAVPGALVTLRRGETEFQVSHRIQRGIRPLHIVATPDGRMFWGEYFDNPARDEVHVYGSADGGLTWEVAYTFGVRSIRHVHSIVWDPWERCLWVFTGDYGRECRILRASPDFAGVDEAIAGNQQARAVGAIITEEGLFFASDTPLEQNFIYHMDRQDRVRRLNAIPSSSIYACRNTAGMFFSTMVEPSEINRSKDVVILGSPDGYEWTALSSWRKDRWPMKFCQYGNAFLPDGDNGTDLLALTTIAVEGADLRTTIWRAIRS